jgi:hypothetical protein
MFMVVPIHERPPNLANIVEHSASMVLERQSHSAASCLVNKTRVFPDAPVFSNWTCRNVECVLSVQARNARATLSVT